MADRKPAFWPVGLWASLASMVLACGDDTADSRGRPSTGSPANAAASADRNAETNDSAVDAGAAAGDGGVPSAPPFTFQTCSGTSEIPVPPDLPSCDGDFPCGGESHCYPLSSASSDLVLNGPDCSVGKCLPDRVFSAQGRIALRPCTGTAGAGACVPHCFALMRTLFSALFQPGEAGCGREELCIPCLNPLDGSSSGACADRCLAGN